MTEEGFYRPDRNDEAAPEYSTAELRTRAALTAAITRDLAVIAAADLSELETLQRRVAAIVNDLKIIRDDNVVKELSAE